jgi:hypothetical protein
MRKTSRSGSRMRISPRRGSIARSYGSRRAGDDDRRLLIEVDRGLSCWSGTWRPARFVEVWRIVLIFTAALVVANTTGLLPEGDDTECVDEDGGKQCPPTCPTCTCAWHTLNSAPVAVFEVQPIELSSRIVALPQPTAWRGRLAPAPTTRPPIA